MATATERIFLASPGTGRTNPALAAPWLFTGEDNLRLVIINSQAGVTITLDGRQLGPDDKSPQAFTQSFKPTADRQPNTFDFAFGAGFLLNCSLVVTAGAPLVGQTYCMLQVIRGLGGARIVLGCLLGGYVTAMQHIAYPGSPIKSSTEDEPFLRVVSGTTPAIGAEVLETVPAGARWELVGFAATYFPAALGAARTVRLFYSQAGVVLAVLPQVTTVAPGTLVGCHWVLGMPMTIAFTGDRILQGLVQAPALLAGMTISTNTVGFMAGDQWFSVAYLVREWLEAS